MNFPKRIRIEHGEAGESPKVFDGDTGAELEVVSLLESKPPMGPQKTAWTQATVTVTFVDAAGRRHRREYPQNRVERVRQGA